MMLMMRMVMMMVAGVAMGVDVPAVVWSGSLSSSSSSSTTSSNKAYDMRRLAASEVGVKMAAAEAAVSLLVVVPRATSVGFVEQLGGVSRRLEASSVEVLPFVEAPGHAVGASASFFETDEVEVVAWADLESRLLRAATQESETLVTVAPDLQKAMAKLESTRDQLAHRAGSVFERSDAWVLGLTAKDGLSPLNNNRRRARRLDDQEEEMTIVYEGVRMTPDILAGVLVGILFLFTVVLGFSCIGAIQTPSQYAKTGPPSLKEW